MSAMGQKRTLTPRLAMVALTHKRTFNGRIVMSAFCQKQISAKLFAPANERPSWSISPNPNTSCSGRPELSHRGLLGIVALVQSKDGSVQELGYESS